MVSESVIEQYIAHLPLFLVALFTFGAAGIVSYFVEVRLNYQKLSVLAFLNYCFPFKWWMHSTTHMDVKIFVIRKLTDRFFRGVSLFFVVAVASGLDGILADVFPHHAPATPTALAIIFCAIAMFVASEFADFVTHFMQHKIPALWEVHKVHHSARFLNPFTAQRGHPVTYIFERAANGAVSGLVAGVFVFIYNLSVVDTLLLAVCAVNIAMILTLDGLKHSHFPVDFGWLDRVLVSPQMHQVHHSSLKHHWDRNYGVNLSIFDWMFGTAYKPSKGEEIVYGLSSTTEEQHAAFDTLYGGYVAPLLKMGKVAVMRSSTPPSATNAA